MLNKILLCSIILLIIYFICIYFKSRENFRVNYLVSNNDGYILDKAPAEGDAPFSETYREKVMNDRLQNYNTVSPAFLYNNTDNSSFGINLPSGLTQTRTGSWKAEIQPVDYNNLRKETTGMFTDIPLKVKDAGPLGFNMNNNAYMACNCCASCNKKMKGKIVEGFSNVAVALTPGKWDYIPPPPTIDDLAEAAMPNMEDIKEAVNAKMEQVSQEVVDKATIAALQKSLDKNEAIVTAMSEFVPDPSCPICGLEGENNKKAIEKSVELKKENIEVATAF